MMARSSLVAVAVLLLELPLVAVARTEPARVLVTGAAGRTGALLYAQLKADARIGEVRALVHNITKARAALGCVKCDPSEGIYLGDVTKPESLMAATRGVDTLAIAAAVTGSAPAHVMKAVEFTGVENQVAALASQANESQRSSLRVVLCSSMGTTNPKPPPFEGGPVLFWKLNAEAWLGSASIGTTIVKPCGLSDGPAGKSALGVGHDDKLPAPLKFTVSRADVARVMVQAIVERTQDLRFLLCDTRGPPTTDLAGLLQSARLPWQP